MDTGLLEDIRALLIGRRATQIRINLSRAESEADIEEMEFDGEMHRVLTRAAALRSTVRELESDKALIAELLRE